MGSEDRLPAPQACPDPGHILDLDAGRRLSPLDPTLSVDPHPTLSLTLGVG